MAISQTKTDAYQGIKDLLGDRLWRIDNFYTGVDDDGKAFKFARNAAQLMLYSAMWYLNIILKARQLGFTTFICIYILDACLFNSNIRGGIIAHTREDAEDIFQHKIKFVYDALPDWFKTSMVTSEQSSARKLSFSNGSSIRVGTSLRSGTYQYILITEHGKICAKYPEKAKEIRTGTLNTVHPGNVVYIESTAEGRGGDFHDFCEKAQNLERQGKELSKMDFKFFFFPWWKRPGNVLDPTNIVISGDHAEYFEELILKHKIELSWEQKAWYVKKYETQQDLMKREHPSTSQEAFESSIIGAYYAQQMAKVRNERRIGRVPYDTFALVHTAWDLGVDDEMSIWFYQVIGNQVNIIDYYEVNDVGIDYCVERLKEKPYQYGSHFSPHDIRQRDVVRAQTAQQRALTELGIKFTRIPRVAALIDDIQAVRRFLNRCFFDEVKCNRRQGKNLVGINSLDSYRKEWNEKQSCFYERPLHNWASHGEAAFRTMMRAVEKYPNGAEAGGIMTQASHNEMMAKFGPPRAL